MAIAKTATLTFRIEQELKEALRTAAEQEHRGTLRQACSRWYESNKIQRPQSANYPATGQELRKRHGQ